MKYSAVCGGIGGKLVLGHYFLGAIHFRQRRYGEALQEFQWCEPRMGDAGIRPQEIYTWFTKTYNALGIKDQARIYETLTKKQ
jgi:hypothetical protein